MRRLLFAVVLLLGSSVWSAAPAAQPTAKSNVPADWAKMFKEYCAGRPVVHHPYPTEKEWAVNNGMTPYFSGPQLRTIIAQEGIYAADDLDVQCLFIHKKVACTNGRHKAQCDAKTCHGGHSDHALDADLEDVEFGSKDNPEVRSYKARRFPRGVFLATGGGTFCRRDNKMVRCRNSLSEQGGFTIDSVFLSVESFFDGGDGWPWDGKCHSFFEREPGEG